MPTPALPTLLKEALPLLAGLLPELKALRETTGTARRVKDLQGQLETQGDQLSGLQTRLQVQEEQLAGLVVALDRLRVLVLVAAGISAGSLLAALAAWLLG